MRVEEDAYFGGTLQAKTLVPSDGCITNAAVVANAGIAASKVDHRYMPVYHQNGNAANATVPIHVVRGATGTIKSFSAGSVGLCTNNAAITVDLKKAGNTILTGVITLNSASTVRVMQDGTISNSSLVDGDWLDVVVTADAGAGAVGTGLLVALELDEDAN
jgi:hypothetical protein